MRQREASVRERVVGVVSGTNTVLVGASKTPNRSAAKGSKRGKGLAGVAFEVKLEEVTTGPPPRWEKPSATLSAELQF
jgi:hypothetical protein